MTSIPHIPEDLVEHLLDVFARIDGRPGGAYGASPAKVSVEDLWFRQGVDRVLDYLLTKYDEQETPRHPVDANMVSLRSRFQRSRIAQQWDSSRPS